ncbi:MAG: hypothetical protein ABR922_07395 [Streptosporangiaceae bacterium]
MRQRGSGGGLRTTALDPDAARPPQSVSGPVGAFDITFDRRRSASRQ